MKKKRIIFITICILICGAIGFLISYKLLDKEDGPKTETKEKEKITPLMYEITREGSNNKIYLFGSIHLSNIVDIEFPEYLMNAYNNSHYLACEFDIIEYQSNQDEMMNDITKMMYVDGSKVSDHLNNETYEKLVNFLKSKGMYSELYEMYKPFFFESLISQIMALDAGINTSSGIDDYFIRKAKSDNKNILEVETGSYQTDLLLSFSDKLYDLILLETIDKYQDEVNDLKELYASWKKGDSDKLLEFSDEEIETDETYTKEQIDLINDYNTKIINDRNQNMTNKLIEYFDNNYDTFYMVGTLHLIGDNGIAKLLEQKGYTVKQIN